MPEVELNEDEVPGKEKNITFAKAVEARGYLHWKEEVDVSFKKLVEASILGKKIKGDKSAHPLLQDFFAASEELLKNPDSIVDILKVNERVKKQVKKLQQVQIDGGQIVNVFDLLRNPDLDFDQKLRWYRAQIEPRLRWLIERAPKLSKETELMPPGPQDTLDPSMDEMGEGKEAPNSGFYEIAPFYGGYYKGHVYEHWDQASLQWKKATKQGQAMSETLELVASTKRSMGGKFKVGTAQAVDLPYGFVIDPSSIPQSEQYEATVVRGADGVWYIKTQAKAGAQLSPEIDLEFEIGKPKSSLPKFVSEPIINREQPAQLPTEVLQKVQDAKSSSLDEISKARILCGFVRNHLEYSNESKYNDIYKQNPAQYFESMWQNKKADCDVANTFAAEVLRQVGIQVRMVSGHYIKSPTSSGTALLHGGTGHAWLEVYDAQTQEWVRMDATPKGDPNMDEDEQEQDLDQNLEGDYGEQDAEIMSDEEIQELIARLEKEEYELEQARKTPEIRFAEEAGCTPEEAGLVLEKIRSLRELKDENGRNVLKKSQKAWGQVIKKNMRERIVYIGPVTMHEGTDLVDPVTVWVGGKARDENPLGFEKPEKRIEIEKAFGGFEVYIAADMSGSMNDVDPQSGQRKCDAQRDAVFLFVDSVMSNAVNAKLYQKKLKNPMPVRICVSVFGATTEIVLPLTDQWGPKEQIKLYRALDNGAGGGTPDDAALEILNKQIQEAKKLEEDIKRKVKSPKFKDWKMNRFVAVFADGGSNNAAKVRKNLRTMRQEGNVVFGFGVTESGRAMEAVYALDAQTIPNASKLAEAGIQKLVETIKKWYDI